MLRLSSSRYGFWGLHFFLTKLFTGKSYVIILGDLNVNTLPNSKQPKKNAGFYGFYIRAFDFTQLIKEPTHITDTPTSLIDLIIVNNEDRIVKSGVVPVPLSDHYLVFCIINF